MIQNFAINSNQIDKIKKITLKEKNFRIKNLEFFNEKGFPNKKHEDWKFSDFKEIISKNFESLDTENVKDNKNKVETIKDFEHNNIFLVNGCLKSYNFDYEEENKVRVKTYDKNSLTFKLNDNPLICLNHALAEDGYFLEIAKDYKCKKTLIIYNFFSSDIKNKILNSKNQIKLNENSEINIIEYVINNSKSKFLNNTYENIILSKNSKYKNINFQSKKSDGYFYKFSQNTISSDATCSSFIFSSGLKFNKVDIESDLVGHNSECNINSALFLNQSEHQEIKTRINHLSPNCKSFQKIKKVLNSESTGVYQGKVYVKDIAQKTNAYQLSKALLLDENSEFNSKPELEIYADDVKCSHGSTSGNIDEDSMYYLMSRGLNHREATQLLIKSFLDEVVESIKDSNIEKFIQLKLQEQIDGY